MAPVYSPIGRPSIDPELLIRMLPMGYYFVVRSERRSTHALDVGTVTHFS